jgi:restriction endonuclease
MLEESNPCTNQHFLSYPFIPSGWTKKIEEVIKLTKELSSEKNYLWKEVSRKGVVYYSVTKQDEKTEEILKEVDQAEEIEAEKLNDEQEDLLRLLYD